MCLLYHLRAGMYMNEVELGNNNSEMLLSFKDLTLAQKFIYILQRVRFAPYSILFPDFNLTIIKETRKSLALKKESPYKLALRVTIERAIVRLLPTYSILQMYLNESDANVLDSFHHKDLKDRVNKSQMVHALCLLSAKSFKNIFTPWLNFANNGIIMGSGSLVMRNLAGGYARDADLVIDDTLKDRMIEIGFTEKVNYTVVENEQGEIVNQSTKALTKILVCSTDGVVFKLNVDMFYRWIFMKDDISHKELLFKRSFWRKLFPNLAQLTFTLDSKATALGVAFTKELDREDAKHLNNTYHKLLLLAEISHNTELKDQLTEMIENLSKGLVKELSQEFSNKTKSISNILLEKLSMDFYLKVGLNYIAITLLLKLYKSVIIS